MVRSALFRSRRSRRNESRSSSKSSDMAAGPGLVDLVLREQPHGGAAIDEISGHAPFPLRPALLDDRMGAQVDVVREGHLQDVVPRGPVVDVGRGYGQEHAPQP